MCPRAERIRFRIGVNLGDAIVEGEDIHGDGVNIAARLEGLAEPGGVWLSRGVHGQVRGKLDPGFTAEAWVERDLYEPGSSSAMLFFEGARKAGLPLSSTHSCGGSGTYPSQEPPAGV